MERMDRTEEKMLENYSFTKVASVKDLAPLLTSRLPNSAHVLNMVKMYPSFTAEMSFFALNQGQGHGLEYNNNCWILGKYEREDTGQQFVISPPNQTSSKPVAVDPKIKEAFSNACPEIIDWDKQFEFVGVERSISHIISEISVQVGNVTEICPCHFYSLKKSGTSSAPRAVDCQIPPGVELGTMNTKAGIDYFVKDWPNVNEKTRIYRTKVVERCPSVGTYLNGVAVSGAQMNASGHIGLVTNEGHRRKGLSNLCLQKLVQKIKEDATQLIPCSMVNVKNAASNGLHVKAGFEITHQCDFIFHKM